MPFMFRGVNDSYTVANLEPESDRDLLRLEVWQHDTGGAHPERAQQLVNDAMNVVEWQGMEDDVISGPRPL